jgi:heat-inducible transcriptional repressor
MLTPRQNEILKALINEYIRTAEPVSSGFLARKYDFGLCPSAIRIEMQFLIKSGFLEQPHTSAGRVPTDRAYRFFVDNTSAPKSGKSIESEIANILNKKNDTFELANDVARFLADASSNLAIVHSLKNHLSWQQGWEEISKEPEFRDQEFAVNLFNFLDDFEEKIASMIPNGVGIFIGHEIPITRARDLSIVCSTCPISSRDTALVSIIGPKRMDYGKNIYLINSVNKALREIF